MRYSILFFLAFAASAAHAATGNFRFDAKLLAEIDNKGSVEVRLVLKNRTQRNVCFFLYVRDARLLARDGTDVPTHLGIADSMGWPPQVQVSWNNGETNSFTPYFGLGEPFQTLEEAQHVARISYRFEGYDCAKLFSLPRGKAPVLYTRDLSVVPTFLP